MFYITVLHRESFKSLAIIEVKSLMSNVVLSKVYVIPFASLLYFETDTLKIVLNKYGDYYPI